MYDRRRMETASSPSGNPGGGKGIVVAAVALFVVAAAGWTAWQLSREMPERAQQAREKAFDVTTVARPAAAPPSLGTTQDGAPVSLATMRGQLVFVNFWATWCPPCRDEMPSMLQLGREMEARHPGKFRMVAVSVDEGWPEVVNFFSGQLPAGVVWSRDAEQAVTRGYYCQARGTCPDSFKFPETYLVDPSGRLVSYVVGPRNWSDPAAREFLERLLPK